MDIIPEKHVSSRQDDTKKPRKRRTQKITIRTGELDGDAEEGSSQIDDPVRIYLTQMGEIPLLTRAEEITLASMSRMNHVHNGAIVRREALEMSRALEFPADPQVVHEDWLVWRRILEQGWRARKLWATYGYRSHAHGVSLTKQSKRPYFDLRGHVHETITLFVPLSGRTAVWPLFRQFLEQQTWPHDQVRLVLLDSVVVSVAGSVIVTTAMSVTLPKQSPNQD